MASIVVSGDTSGSVTLSAPAVAGTTTQTLPLVSGNVLNDANCGVCKAWVNFNGVTTATIRASFNVSSITRNGTGDYTVNFTTALVDANYATFGTILSQDAGSYSCNVKNGTTPTSSAVNFIVRSQGATNSDSANVFIQVLR